MSSTFGNILKVSLFGESHGSCVGLTINNFPSGVEIPYEDIKRDLIKRRSNHEISTTRIEADEVVFLSGVLNNYTTGAPLTFIIENKNTKPFDYKKGIVRPSHADLAAYEKYNGFNDYRGGGHFSGRLTAAIVVLGTLCKILLKQKNTIMGTHIAQIKDVCDDNLSGSIVDLNCDGFPVINDFVKEKMISII